MLAPHPVTLDCGMPKRSRGFWVCDYCELTFDHFDEAKAHQDRECPRGTAAAVDPSRFPEHPEYYSFGEMAPLSRTDPLLVHPSGGHAYGYAPQQQQQQQQQRLLHGGMLWTRRLLDSEQSTYLTEEDAMACRCLELFQLDTTSFDQSSSVQLGLRCCYCKDDQSRGHDSYIIPTSDIALGNNVRLLSDNHLVSCNSVPVDVSSTLRAALRKRSRLQAEAGPSWHEEERYRRSLAEFCVARCQQLHVVNRRPHDSGIALDTMRSFGSGLRVGSSETALAAAHGRGKDGGSQNRSWEMPVPTEGRLDPSFGPSYRSSSPSMAASQGGGDLIELMPLETHEQMPVPDQPRMGMSFPFFQTPNGDWICKYCSNLPPEYREQHFIWSTPSKEPPTNSFVSHHLSFCGEYNRSNTPYYQGSTPGFPYMGIQSPASFMQQQQPPWETMPDQPATSQFRPQEYAQRIPVEASRVPVDYRERSSNASPQVFAQPVDSLSPPSRGVEGGEMDASTRRSVEHLVATDLSMYDNSGQPLSEESRLVVDEDHLLLTDYFYYLMKQLRLARFSEADRRTRGGKREKIKVGYGGLQCVHCADAANARKFYWSNVDRLANSFAEIPGHILKCRRCPQATKDALLQLKKLHPEQMARLPRGSQKIFFRRMWRRLHDGDSSDSPPDEDHPFEPATQDEPVSPDLDQLETKLPPMARASPARTIGSDESIILFERPATEAAKALADASMQGGPPSPSSRILLSIPEDKEWLSDTDCFVRRQIEVFCATKEDVQASLIDRKYGITEGQVGIRCVHCALGKGARMNAVTFPSTISGFYESVREFQRLHLEECTNLPPAVQSKLWGKKNACSSLSSVLRKYYILSAQALGLHDTKDGVRAGAKSAPVGSQATFAFSEGSSSVSEEMKRATESASLSGEEIFPVAAEEGSRDGSRKRRHVAEPATSQHSKKSPGNSSF